MSTSLPRTTAQTFAANPWQFFWLQLPVGSVEILERCLTTFEEKGTRWGIFVLLPYFMIASALATSATFSFILQKRQGRVPTLWTVWNAIAAKLPLLIPAALLVGLVCGLGIIALILPGLYFMTLYLFVPHLIVYEERSPLMTHLYKSTHLAKAQLKKTFSVVLVISFLSLFVFFGGETIGTWLGGVSTNGLIQNTLLVSIKALFAMLAGVFIDIFTSEYFLKLREAK